MKLIDRYYKIKSRNGEVFSVSLLPDFVGYKGHFPNNPVAPGVCNIQMIKELVENIVGKRLFLSNIAKCRFLNIINPLYISDLQINISVVQGENSYTVEATVKDAENKTCIEFKGNLTPMP